MLPLVTIVTPSLNQGRFIRATIESVLSQDYPHVEYIIMDGGSTDETAQIASEYASRLQFVSERDRGQSHAINKGFRAARGEIVAWLNSDDLMLPNAISHAIEGFRRNPRAGAVYGEGYLIDESGATRRRFPVTEPFNLWKLLYLSDYVLQQTVYFRRSVIEEAGYLDESLHWGLDWDILMRIAMRYPLEYIPEYMGCLREHDAAKTSCGGTQRLAELGRILRRHGGKRFPPGYFVYGLETWARVVSGRLAGWTPGYLDRPSRFVQRAFTHACHLTLDRIVREAQGYYSDGWAGPRLRWMVPAGTGRLEISGELPDVAALRSQQLAIRCNGTMLTRAAVAPGQFTLEVETASVDRPVHLHIAASRYLTPDSDPRRLAWRMRSIDWA